MTETMTTPSTPTAEAERLWFLNVAKTVRVPHEAGADGISVLESHAPYGDSPPLHIHHGEDEIFCVLEGEMRLRVGDGELRLGPGETALAPKGIPHTYRVESAEGARCLVITSHGDFERFVRSLSRPPETDGLPEPAGPPSPEQALALADAARAHDIEIVGPPLGA